MDPGIKEALEEQLRIGQALKRKIQTTSGTGRGEDDDEGGSTDASDDDDDEGGGGGGGQGQGSKGAKLKVLEILSGEMVAA